MKRFHFRSPSRSINCEDLIISNRGIAGMVLGVGSLGLAIEDPDIGNRDMDGWIVIILSISPDIEYSGTMGWWMNEYVIQSSSVSEGTSLFTLITAATLPAIGSNFQCLLGQIKFSKNNPGV